MQCLRKSAASSKTDLLIMLIDTLEVNLMSFSALGESRPLLFEFMQHYRRMRTKISPHKEIVSGLATIARKLGLGKNAFEYLEREPRLCEPQPGIAAFTPVSDYMPAATSVYTSAMEEEIERLAANPSSPDEQTFSRVFGVLIEEFSDAIQSVPGKQRHLVGPPLLRRLQDINTIIFDYNMTDWLNLTLPQSHTIASQQVLVALLAGLYASLPVLHTVTECIFAELASDRALRSRFANFMLLCITHTNDVNLSLSTRVSERSPNENKSLIRSQDEYRFRILQQDFCSTYPTTIVKLCLSTTHFCTTALLVIDVPQVRDWMQTNDVSSCLKICILSDPKCFLAQLNSFQSSEYGANTVRAIIRFLKGLTTGDYPLVNEAMDDLSTNRSSLKTCLEEMFQQLNELSLPFFQILLECITTVHKLADNAIEILHALVLECVTLHRDDAPFVWSRLFSGFNSFLGLQVRRNSYPWATGH